MKILQVISSFPPAYSYGGALNVAYNLSKKLAEIGHEIIVYTTDVLDNRNRYKIIINPERNEGMVIYRFKNISNLLTSLFHISCAPGIILKIRKNIKNFDIIHCHEFRSFEAVVMHHYATTNNIPYILQAHGSVLPILEKERLKKVFDKIWGINILKDAKKIIAVSYIEKKQYEKMGVPENKIEVIPNGLNITEYEMLAEQGYFRKKYGISNQIKLILFLGRLHKRKGIDFLIYAFFDLFKKNNNCLLIIAGPDDGFLDTILKIIKELNIHKNVIITGELSDSDKKEAYVDADILVYPGIYEIFGLVPFEALLCGTPVIVSEDCGCGEIIKKAICGRAINCKNIQELSDNINRVLEDDELATKFVKNGQAYIRNYLQYNTLTDELLKVYASN
jgi:glycosyltransferase involved in cell wall biosynthesis